MTHPPVVHHVDIPESELARGDIAFRRRRLGAAAGCRSISASHFVVPPGARQMPVHVHGDSEEIFYVAEGTGIAHEHEGESFAVAPGDVVVHRPRGRAHTFLAGDNGLELIVFDSGSESTIGHLPRAGVMWCGPHWVPVDAPHPFEAELAAGPLLRPSVDPTAPRPAHVVALDDLPTGPHPPAEIRAAGAAAGATKAGLNHVTLPPGRAAAPPHCHSLEEELFVVLGGSGTLTLGDGSAAGGGASAGDVHPLAAGDVVARPPGTGITHVIGAGPGGLVYLAYGTREPGDAVHYPRSGEIRLRGLGVSIAVTPG